MAGGPWRLEFSRGSLLLTASGPGFERGSRHSKRRSASLATNLGSLAASVFCLPAHSLVNTCVRVRARGLLSVDWQNSSTPARLACPPLPAAGGSYRPLHSQPAQKSNLLASAPVLLSVVPRSNLKQIETPGRPRLAAHPDSLRRLHGGDPAEAGLPSDTLPTSQPRVTPAAREGFGRSWRLILLTAMPLRNRA
jgi:hypothetical protein